MENNDSPPMKSLTNLEEMGKSNGFSLETQQAKINEWRNDPKIRYFLYNTYLKNSVPILKLDVVSLENCDCELDEEDIQAVFENFGKIAEVKVKAEGKAFIIFHDILDAYFAQAYLNNRVIEEDQIRLKVDWCSHKEIEENELQPPKKEPKELVEEPRNNMEPFFLNNNGNSLRNEDLGVPSNTKLTCRYNIQIENEKDFQVARRIIGPKGCHMKRIIDACIKEAPHEPPNDLIKLRLRGKGSGYKEGADKQESQEPLHLCLSSAHQPSYLLACRLVEEHLLNVYDEYKKYCVINSRNFDVNLTIKKLECSNIKSLLDNPKSTNLKAMVSSTNNIPQSFENKSANNLEEEFATKMKIDIICQEQTLNNTMNNSNNINENSNNNNNSNILANSNGYIKEFPSFSMKKSEPFYPGLNKTPYNAEQNFYPVGQMNKNLLLPGAKAQPQPKVLPNFGNYNPNFVNYQQNLPSFFPNPNANNPTPNANNSNVNSMLKEMNITEEEIKKLIEDRNKARREQNFIEADRIRNFLKMKGIALMDEKGGRGKGTEVTTWKICRFNYNNQKNNEIFAFSNSNSNAFYHEEGNNSGYNAKFFKYNP